MMCEGALELPEGQSPSARPSALVYWPRTARTYVESGRSAVSEGEPRIGSGGHTHSASIDTLRARARHAAHAPTQLIPLSSPVQEQQSLSEGAQRKMSKHIHIVRFEVFTAVTMKNAVFWDIKLQFVPHRKHITSLLEPTWLVVPMRYFRFHGGDYEECRFLRCYAVWLL
jgi:hypothetical protein